MNCPRGQKSPTMCLQTLEAMPDQEPVEDYGLPNDAIVNNDLEPETAPEPAVSTAQQELEQAIDDSLAEMLAKPDQPIIKTPYNELPDSDIRPSSAGSTRRARATRARS